MGMVTTSRNLNTRAIDSSIAVRMILLEHNAFLAKLGNPTLKMSEQEVTIVKAKIQELLDYAKEMVAQI